MALYSFRGQYVGITHQLKSCVSAAAYRAGERLYDPRTGEAYDYCEKQVAHSEIAAPADAPAWVQDRQTLWSKAELARNRAVGVTARELRIALPRELTREQQLACVRGFLRDEFTSRGIVADWSLHDEAGKNQPHVHVMLTTRALTPDGFGNKVREWDHKPLYNRWREQWAVHANRALELAGHDERIDHRSYKERGIDLMPQPKLYRQAEEAHTDGRDLSARMAAAEQVARENGERILADPTIPLKMLTHQRATFRREDLLKVLNTHTADEPQFTACLHAVLACPELVELPTGRYTSREMLAVEKRLFEAGDALAVSPAHEVSEKHLERAIERADRQLAEEAHARGEVAPKVSDEQRRGIAHLTRSSGSIAILEGHAGTGKSFLLGITREAWEAEGYTVVGGALAGKAAEGLQGSSGIESRTLASWERSWALDRDHLSDKHVLVIDEAGMLGTRQLGRVLDHARLAGAKVVLVGDSRQLQAIEAGSPFRALGERLGSETLSEIRRQRVAWQREASMAFASGRARDGVEAYLAKGQVQAHLTSEEARAAVVKSWAAGLASTPLEKQLMFAYRRDDVHALNQAAREVRRAQGALGTDYEVTTERGVRAFARGDRVFFGKNDRELNVKNGTLGTVEQMGVHRMTVRLDGEGTQRLVRVDLGKYQHLDHGYAATVHKSQGATLERSYVLASKLYDSSKSYVSMSRQRDHAEMHWARDEFGSRGELMRVLTRELTKELASEQLAVERSFTLEEVLRDDSTFSLLSPVEQRRMIHEAEAASVAPLPLTQYRDVQVRAQPEVRAADKKLGQALQALTEAQEALEAYRESPFTEKRFGGERELTRRVAVARDTEQEAAREVREAMQMQSPPVVARAEQELARHNQAAAQWSRRVQGWRERVAEVERVGVVEHVLELGAQVTQRDSVRWARAEDAGLALKALGTLPQAYRIGGRERSVGMFEAPDGSLVMSDLSSYEATQLKRGDRVSLIVNGRGGLELERGVGLDGPSLGGGGRGR